MRNLVVTLALADGHITRLWCKTRLSAGTLYARIQAGKTHDFSDEKGSVETFETALNPRYVVHVTDQGPA